MAWVGSLMLLDTASLYYRAFFGVPETVRAPDGTRLFLDTAQRTENGEIAITSASGTNTASTETQLPVTGCIFASTGERRATANAYAGFDCAAPQRTRLPSASLRRSVQAGTQCVTVLRLDP